MKTKTKATNVEENGSTAREMVDLEPDTVASLATPPMLPSFGREALGRIIQKTRKERGLSPYGFADDAGVSIEVIEMLESGTGLPSARHLLSISELLEISFQKVLILVGLVRTENPDILHSALEYLATTTRVEPNSREFTHARQKFMRALQEDAE